MRRRGCLRRVTHDPFFGKAIVKRPRSEISASRLSFLMPGAVFAIRCTHSSKTKCSIQVLCTLGHRLHSFYE